jgi:hypothetical protein
LAGCGRILLALLLLAPTGECRRQQARSPRSNAADAAGKRQGIPVVPPHVEYRLTPLGEEIGRKVEALADWIEDKLPQIRAAQRGKPPREATG